MTSIDEIADGIYRIFTPIDIPGAGGFSFNQYLIADDEPLLFHTGLRRLFRQICEAVARVMPVERLRWLALSHFEADECGALNQFLAVAPQAEPLCGRIAAMVSVGDYADRTPRALDDGESVLLGRHEVR
jgi:flavorubredoxin